MKTNMFLCTFLVMLLPALSRAQTTSPAHPPLVAPLSLTYVPTPLLPVPEGSDVIVSIKKGDPAPFAGQLMTPETALRWLNYLEQARQRLREDVLLERRTCNAYLGYYDRRVDLERGARETIELDLRTRILTEEERNVKLQDRLSNPGFFQTNTFWFLAGIVSTGVVLGVGVAALHEVK